MTTTPVQESSHDARSNQRTKSRAKAIIAIAAGTALLLGGAGTYAYWSTTQALNAGTVTSGDLDLALGTATWSLDGVLTAPTAVADPAAVKIVPGDVLTLTQALDVTLVGDNLEALLAVDLGTAIPAGSTDWITVTFTTTAGTAEGTNTYRLTPANAATPISATVTITFDPATPNRESVTTPLDLGEVTFTLTQASS